MSERDSNTNLDVAAAADGNYHQQQHIICRKDHLTKLWAISTSKTRVATAWHCRAISVKDELLWLKFYLQKGVGSHTTFILFNINLTGKASLSNHNFLSPDPKINSKNEIQWRKATQDTRVHVSTNLCVTMVKKCFQLRKHVLNCTVRFPCHSLILSIILVWVLTSQDSSEGIRAITFYANMSLTNSSFKTNLAYLNVKTLAR
jgi:hypothetical protein